MLDTHFSRHWASFHDQDNIIAIQAFLKKEEKSQIDNLTQHLNELEKEKQNLKTAEGRK